MHMSLVWVSQVQIECFINFFFVVEGDIEKRVGYSLWD